MENTELGIALKTFERFGIAINANFYSLSLNQTIEIGELAKRAKFKKPISAMGSAARYYFERIKRMHARSLK
jgi:hypothetical protein